MKKVKIVFSVIALYIIVSSSHCEKGGHGDDRLTIVNKSNAKIASFLQYNYPDTSIQPQNTPGFNAISVEPFSENVHLTFVKWEKLIPQNNSQNTLMLFIYSADTIMAKRWTEIQAEYNILKRYDLTLEQLKNQNWKVIYP